MRDDDYRQWYDIESADTMAKRYLKVDYHDDDRYIKDLVEVSFEYIAGMVDFDEICYQKNRARLRMLQMTIIADLYERRAMTFDIKQTNTNTQFVIRSIINQLQEGDDCDLCQYPCRYREDE